MTAIRPEPRPGILAIDPYVPGKSGAAGLAKVWKLSSNETPARPEPEGARRLCASRRQARTLSGGLPCGAARGDRGALWTRSGPHHLRRRLRRASVLPRQRLSQPWRRGPLQRPRLPGLQDRHPGGRRDPCCRTRDRPSADVDALLSRVTPRTSIVFLANPEQPDRHLPAVRRGQAAACRASSRHPPGPRCRLCRICPSQRLRGGAGARRHCGKRRDDAHLFEDPRPRQPPPRLDGWPRPPSSTPSTASAGRSTSAGRPWPPASPRWRRSPSRCRHRPQRGMAAASASARSPRWASS